MPTSPAILRRTARKPTINEAMASTTMIPVRSANLSLVPNHWIASSFNHGGARSMNSLPTASIGDTTSRIPATSMPVVTATAPATSPADVPNKGGIEHRDGGAHRLIRSCWFLSRDRGSAHRHRCRWPTRCVHRVTRRGRGRSPGQGPCDRCSVLRAGSARVNGSNAWSPEVVGKAGAVVVDRDLECRGRSVTAMLTALPDGL